MHRFRLVIGESFVVVGFVLTSVALWLIVSTGGGSRYMYAAWGLGFLAMSLGFNYLPKKKQHRESVFARRLREHVDDKLRGSSTAEKQKSIVCETSIESPPSISKVDFSDTITKEQASEE